MLLPLFPCTGYWPHFLSSVSDQEYNVNLFPELQVSTRTCAEGRRMPQEWKAHQALPGDVDHQVMSEGEE